MPKNKPKLKGVTFQLVHRSQQDPLIVDETAPQRVLLPVAEKQSKSKKTTDTDDNDEHEKYGIYFDEDYQYLKHLKDVKDNHMEWPEHVEEALKQREKENAAKKLQLASSVFASKVQEDVGMLNKAAPVSGLQLHLDPDIVAAMDDDFDYNDPDNQLEDNFFDLADGIASDEELEIIDEEMEDQFGSDGSERSFTKQETKSRFTNYSMTSSVIRRNEQLQLLDNRFEKMYEQYDDSEIGVVESPEDCEENPAIFEDLLKKYAEEFAEDQKLQKLDKGNDPVLNKTKELCEFTQDEDDEENTESENSDEEEMEKWDCQTILSTYSNTQNLPKLIELPNLKKKIQLTKLGIPKNTLNNANKLTINALNQLNQQNNYGLISSSSGPKSMAQSSIISQLSALSIRAKNETVEERKKRKLFLKEFRRERRKEKKENSVAFKELKKEENKIILNNRNNIQGNKIL